MDYQVFLLAVVHRAAGLAVSALKMRVSLFRQFNYSGLVCKFRGF